jgi:CHAD domain-containing protein
MGADAILYHYLWSQIDEIFAGDAGLRSGADPIHDTRVAIRRARGTLRVFRALFDRDAVQRAVAELKWFAGLLGEVRDCQVQLHRFSDALDELPVELVMGPVRAAVTNHLLGIELPARRRVAEVMQSDRYQGLQSSLRQWRTQPPVVKDFGLDDLRKHTKRARRKADARLSTALLSDDGPSLHRARKAAKRARYASEAMTPVDSKAKRRVKHYREIQTVLGDHQDAVVAMAAVRRMAACTGTAGGHNGFTFGLLYAREVHIADESRRAARKLI